METAFRVDVMALKDLLVYVDSSEEGKKRVEFACELASLHEAHLTGVAFVLTGAIPQFVGPGIPPLIASAEFLESGRVAAKEALDQFTKIAERYGISYETRKIEGLPPNLPDMFAVHARHVDLAVLGQPAESAVASGEEILIERVLFQSGRGALIVPHSGARTADPKIIVAAWDGSQEAARAFHEAMPFLLRANQVEVMAVEPDMHEEDYGEEPAADIALHLARHGIKAEVVRAYGQNASIGELLITRSNELGADMLVMGAFHHSRLREFVLGGVTRTVLEKMTVPVLMAH